MRTKLFAAAALLAFAATSAAMAQQASGQDDQSNAATARQTSTSWSNANAQPEQTGDFYQAQTRNNDNLGAATQGGVLPGALNPGTESLNDGKQPDPKD